MAEQKTDRTGISSKSFKNIQFSQEDSNYDIDVECNGKAETIRIKLLNKQSTKIYEQTFTKETIESITSECKLPAYDLSQIILDQLSSPDFITKFCRLFVFADTQQALEKETEFRKLRDIPDSVGTIKHSEGNPNVKEGGHGVMESNSKPCILFLIHFSPSKYVKCNYVFIIPEKNLTDSDRFDIKYIELKQENEELRKELKDTKTNLTQKIQELTIKLQQLENKINSEDEQKIQKIDLNLLNGWQWYGTSNYKYGKPKAFKSGKIVYLQGLLKGGKNGTVVATLPDSYRPDSERIFCVNQMGTCARINVVASGGIVVYAGYTAGWLPLDGIVYHMDK